jgi:hypothetical protein
VVIRGVAVEKVGLSEKSQKSGDRKCPGDSEKSFVESFLTRSNFCEFVESEFFNSHRISQHYPDRNVSTNLPDVVSDCGWRRMHATN